MSRADVYRAALAAQEQASARISELEVALARAEARAAFAEKLSEQFLGVIERTLGTAAAQVLATPSAPASVPERPAAPEDGRVDPIALTPKIRALCKRYDDGSPRQLSVNLAKAQQWAREGLHEDKILDRLHRGEQVTP